MLSRKIVIPMAAVAVIAAGVFGVAQVSAAGSNTSGQNNLAQKIADTFHLDKNKVQAVIDQNRQDNQVARETKYETRLSQGITDGKLTAAQKALVLSEHQILASKFQTAMMGASASRRTGLQNIRTEAQDWAKANSIAVSWLIGGDLGGLGHGGFRHLNEASDSDLITSPSPTPKSGA